MKNIVVSLSIVSVLMVGCGGGASSPIEVTQESITNDTNSKQILTTNSIAKDNTLKEVVKSFRTYQIKVLTDKTIADDAVSNDTFALYGNIDGENTAALLKLNTNYPLGTKVTVKVFDNDSKKLVAESEPVVYNGGVVNFGILDVENK